MNAEGITALKDVAEDFTQDQTPLDRYSCMFTDMDSHYRCLLGTIPSIVYTLDEKGHFTYLSDSVQSIGYTRNELLGNHFSVIVHPDDIHSVSRDDVLPLFSGMTTGPRRSPKLFDERRTFPRKTSDLEIRLVPGKSNTMEGRNTDQLIRCKVYASGQYTPHPANRKPVFCGTLGVITEINSNHDGKANGKQPEMVSAMIKSVTHDFNNILTSLYGNFQLIEMRAEKPELQETLTTIRENLERAARLVRRLGAVA